MSNTKTIHKITTRKMKDIQCDKELIKRIQENKIIYDENKTYQPTEYYHFALYFCLINNTQLAIKCLERGVSSFKPFLLSLWELNIVMQNYNMADMYLNRAVEENVDGAIIIKLDGANNKKSLCAGM